MAFNPIRTAAYLVSLMGVGFIPHAHSAPMGHEPKQIVCEYPEYVSDRNGVQWKIILSGASVFSIEIYARDRFAMPFTRRDEITDLGCSFSERDSRIFRCHYYPEDHFAVANTSRTEIDRDIMGGDITVRTWQFWAEQYATRPIEMHTMPTSQYIMEFDDSWCREISN